MNKIIIIAVFIFWVAVSFFYANNLINKKQQAPIIPNNVSQLPQATQTGEVFTFGLVAQHNTVADCWVTSGNTVYNVTSYLKQHPGGQSAITPYCGADVTTAFNAQGHSQNAADILKSLAIGVIGGAVDSNSAVLISDNNAVAAPAANNVNNQPPVASGETLTLALVSQHNTAGDCWVTSGSTVYNVTNYLNAHPGGRSAITPYCGSDIAAAFTAQGHSQNAANILNGLAIGVIGGTVANNPASTTPPPITNNGRHDDDGEDDD